MAAAASSNGLFTWGGQAVAAAELLMPSGAPGLSGEWAENDVWDVAEANDVACGGVPVLGSAGPTPHCGGNLKVNAEGTQRAHVSTLSWGRIRMAGHPGSSSVGSGFARTSKACTAGHQQGHTF